MAKLKGKDVENVLDTMLNACTDIREADGCGACPMKNYCLDEEPFANIADAVPAYRIDEFLGFAGDIDDYNCKRDMEDYYWEQKRDSYIEERMIDMEWGY